MREVTAERVLDELAQIAFAEPEDVKTADRLRALELLYKHLGLAEAAAAESVVIVDEA